MKIKQVIVLVFLSLLLISVMTAVWCIAMSLEVVKNDHWVAIQFVYLLLWLLVHYNVASMIQKIMEVQTGRWFSITYGIAFTLSWIADFYS